MDFLVINYFGAAFANAKHRLGNWKINSIHCELKRRENVGQRLGVLTCLDIGWLGLLSYGVFLAVFKDSFWAIPNSDKF